MKSNYERSNECLPPKKREIPSSTLPTDFRSPAVPPATDSQRTENMAWLASVAAGSESAAHGHRSSGQPDSLHNKSLFSTSDSSSSSSSLRLVSSLPTVYTSALSQSAVGGTVHYAQLPPNLQFIASPYSAPYASYISPQLLPPPPPPPPFSSSSSSSQRHSHTETISAPSHASKHEQQRAASAGRTSMPPPSTDLAPHYVQMSTSTRTVPSPHYHGGIHLPPQSLHPHHTLGHGLSHLVVQYTDGPTRKEDGGSRSRELHHNGELDRGRRYGVSPESGLSKPGGKSRDAAQSLSSYEARQLVLHSDYSTHDPSGMRTSYMLMPNSHGDHQMLPPRPSPEKLTTSAPAHLEKGGIVLGRPVNRTSSSSNSSSPFTFPPPLSVESLKAAVSRLSPQTVIQTTHSATESLSMGLPSTIYPQPPLIGYIAGGGGSQHTPIGYHAGLQQHVLIPGAQQVIIPVSGGGVTSLEPIASHITSQASPFPPTLPQTYIAAPKGEGLEPCGASYLQAASGAAVQAHLHLHLPVVPSPPGPAAAAAAPPSSREAAPHSLPPYFIKGSIIQLADGELKRVEELKTEDFIQSAEISSELKIDSSTVERIDGSHTSNNFAVVQFSVGEHRAQVSVEVLVEYPFFVFGQGWSSCCPDRTTQLLELPCTKLSVGDVCISLTLKNLRNGSLRKTQTLELVAPASDPASSHGHLKPPRAVGSDAPQSCGGGASRHGERENGISQRGSGSGGGSNAVNGELVFGEKGSVSGARKPSGSRKRRWSAPEGRKVDKPEEEPPLTLPKPSFLPYAVKVSIEGRSNMGK
ncbi:Ataxin-1 [Liparis tanakae]|uniref:Ataxin-1 n=1 Tax=Liparis tanakae TaxID=230148 RepID=A0A4Z2J7L3_9TELE|nr:Ataxin-1 [Liparis tanakae]